MDIFDTAILHFWKALSENEVNYITIGGFATNIHGFQRYTGDMDIWIEDSLENRRKLRQAFISAEIGDYPMLETMQFVPGWTEFHLPNGLRLDILVDMVGLEEYTFHQCLSIATVADIEGINIPFLHINQLIQNKKAVNRPKDQIDVIELEHIKRIRSEMGLGEA